MAGNDPSNEEFVEHQVNNDPGDGDIHPDRVSPARQPAMAVESVRESERESDQNHRHNHGSKHGM